MPLHHVLHLPFVVSVSLSEFPRRTTCTRRSFAVPTQPPRLRAARYIKTLSRHLPQTATPSTYSATRPTQNCATLLLGTWRLNSLPATADGSGRRGVRREPPRLPGPNGITASPKRPPSRRFFIALLGSGLASCSAPSARYGTGCEGRRIHGVSTVAKPHDTITQTPVCKGALC
jgi:hypothetical protein